MTNTVAFSDRVMRINASPTLALDAKVKQMQKSGGDIINLGVGEPDFDTPDYIKDAALKALREGKTKYTPVAGIPELKEAICSKLLRDNHLNYQPNQVIVSNGAKQSIYNTIQCLVNEGDEVIIPAPYWVTYPEIVNLAGGKCVFLPTTAQKSFKITPEQLANAINENTKLVILNSPNNPSGMIYSQTELEKLAEVCLANPHVFILSDDIYEHIRWNDLPFCNIVNVCESLAPRTILVNGLSKAYAMTGWRIGYAAASEEITQAMVKIQSQSTSNANSIAQYAAVAALNGDQSAISSMIKTFKSRHDLVYQALQSIPDVICMPSQGAFYAFPDVSHLIPNIAGGLENDIQLSEYLLTKAGVAVVPGSAFGAPGCIRLSFATNTEKLQDALNRLTIILKKKK